MSAIAYDLIKYAIRTGTRLSWKGLIQEAALRMLLNNFKTMVAECADERIMYSLHGLAAKDFPALNDIIAVLKILENNETLLIKNGKALSNVIIL